MSWRRNICQHFDVIQLSYDKKGAIRCIVHPKTRFQKLYILPCGKSMGSSGVRMLFLNKSTYFPQGLKGLFKNGCHKVCEQCLHSCNEL
jgi:hypothetical protein